MMDYNNNDSQYIEEAKDLVINSIGETMDLYGINRSVGNLYGIMVFEGSMTLDEMRQQLQMSKPSMSTGVKNYKNTISSNNNSRVVAESNILLQRKISSLSSATFLLKNGNVKLTLIWKQLKMQKISFTHFLKRMI